ncbi:MAG TPA: hypothetical protein PK668_20780 [Myxococcota bacterium]|nr:hypothetical protein [Myxococcota bacterium]HRY96653.1 hypothetical protein [Myxococcota bacterium]HSA22392.1 hypothetical protein [Myxococcota bacterium]
MILETRVLGVLPGRASARALAGELDLDLSAVAGQLAVRLERIPPEYGQALARLGPPGGLDLDDLRVVSALVLALQSAEAAQAASLLQGAGGEPSALPADLDRYGPPLAWLADMDEHLDRSIEECVAWMTRGSSLPVSGQLPSLRAEALQLVKQGLENLRSGFEEDAFARFERALERDNTCYLAHAELARMCAARRDDGRAEEHHLRAVSYARASGALEAGLGLRFSRFLERRGRVAEAAAQIENALQQKGLIDDWEARWRFHLAELLADPSPARALDILGGMLQGDGVSSVPVMGSVALHALQPGITRLLVGLAVGRRREGLAALATAAGWRRALATLSESQPPRVAPGLALDGVLVMLQPLEELPSSITDLESAGDELRDQAESSLRARVAGIACRIEGIASQARRDWRAMWPERPPDPPSAGADPPPARRRFGLLTLGAFAWTALWAVFAVVKGAVYYTSATAGREAYLTFIGLVALVLFSGCCAAVWAYIDLLAWRAVQREAQRAARAKADQEARRQDYAALRQTNAERWRSFGARHIEALEVLVHSVRVLAERLGGCAADEDGSAMRVDLAALEGILREPLGMYALFANGPLSPCEGCGGLPMLAGMECTQCGALEPVWLDPEDSHWPRACKRCGDYFAPLGRQRPAVLTCPACGRVTSLEG